MNFFRRCITVRVTGTTPLLAFRLDKLQKLAKRFLDLMYEKSLDEHPIIFHVFSNSAALVYQLVSLEMQKRNKTLPVYKGKSNAPKFYCHIYFFVCIIRCR